MLIVIPILPICIFTELLFRRILGAILGFKWYESFRIEKGMLRGDFPEFYENLKNFKIAIIPQKPYFTKRLLLLTILVAMQIKRIVVI